MTIIATFHTHPNTGPDYLQAPSPTDILAVQHGPDLGHPEYEGEYIISAETVYLVLRDGSVKEIGPTDFVLRSSNATQEQDTEAP